MEEIKNKQSKKQLLGEIARFLLIGGFATIVDYVVFYLSTYLFFKGLDDSTNKIISTFLGFVAGLIINWIFSARFVYKYEKKTTNKQLLIYIAICVAGLLITELGIFLAMPLYETLYVTIIVTFDFWQLFFKCLMTVIVLILNYLGRKYLIFNK